MKKYIVRSLKYFFALCVLCIALMGLMLMTGTSALSPSTRRTTNPNLG